MALYGRLFRLHALRLSTRMSTEAANKPDTPSDTSPKWKTDREDMFAAMNKNKQFTSQIKAAFHGTPPRIVGLCKSEWLRKSEILEKAGVAPDEAQLAAFRLPAALDFDAKRMRDLVPVLKAYGLNLRRLLKNAPLVAALDPKQVADNLKKLSDVGLTHSQIRSFLYLAPSALGLPLSQWTVQRAEQLKEMGYANVTIGEAIDKALRLRSYAAAMEISGEDKGEDEMSCFLHDLGVPIDRVLSKCPSFFSEDIDHIREMCDILCSPPLFCSTENLSRILTQVPHLFPQWTEQYLVDQLTDLIKITQTPDFLLNRLLHSTATVLDVLKPPTTVKERLQVMEKHGLTQNEQHRILWAHSLYFSLELNDVDRRLGVLLGHGDITHRTFLEKPGETAVMGYHRLIARLDFGRHYDAKRLAELGMRKLCHVRDETYASFYGKTLNDYLEFVKRDTKYLSPSVLRTRSRTR
ncbi:uncharacterized protein [Oscarella lobularis]|uniref:uncharacterized protein n=1 Tax=Oscarella lobularis TaxID=121494 RepID=UPI0033131F23